MKEFKNSIAVLEKIKKPLRILNHIKIPTLKYGQVIVKIEYTGICGSQIFEIQGKRDSKKYIPHVLGHEASGIIVRKHHSVKKVQVGDEVFISWIKSFGRDAKNIYYKSKKIKKKINSGKVATFMKFSILPENCINKFSNRITIKEAVLLGCALPTGAGMIINQSKISKNDKILILGLGGVGVSTLMATKLYKNINVCAYDINKSIVKKVKPYFKNCNFLNKSDFFKLKRDCVYNNKNGFDKIFETTGTVIGIETSIDLLKNSGELIFASHPEKNKKISIDPFEFIKGKKIIGSWGGETNFKKNLNDFIKIILLNRPFIKEILKNTYKFSDINIAINDLMNKKVLRPIINPND